MPNTSKMWFSDNDGKIKPVIVSEVNNARVTYSDDNGKKWWWLPRKAYDNMFFTDKSDAIKFHNKRLGDSLAYYENLTNIARNKLVREWITVM